MFHCFFTFSQLEHEARLIISMVKLPALKKKIRNVDFFACLLIDCR